MSTNCLIIAAAIASALPNWDNVELLSHFNGVNGATNTADETGKIWTLNAGATISTTASKFSGSCLKFDGTSNAYASTSFPALGTEDFTIEFFVRLGAVSAGNGVQILDARPNNTNGPYPAINNVNGVWGFYVNGGLAISGGATTLNQFHHIALCRKDGVTKFFIDGSQVGSNYADNTNYLASTLVLGKNAFLAANMNGYIDELRVKRGEAVYTANFVPPGQAFANRSGQYTAALLHFDGANGVSATADETGKAVIVGPSAALSSAQAKFGSTSLGCNDLAGSYAKIGIPSIGTSDFTMEVQVRFAGIHGAEGYNAIVECRSNANGPYPFIFAHGGQWVYHANSTYLVSGGAVVANTWYHVVVERKNGITKMYINGTQVGSSYTDNNDYPATILTLGHNAFVSNGLIGHIDEFRLTIGGSRYGANFTPPVAPFILD